MKKVKLNPGCWKNHRHPHVPWYINAECDALQKGFDEILFIVDGLSYDKSYSVFGIDCGHTTLFIKPGYTIWVKDTIITPDA